MKKILAAIKEAVRPIETLSDATMLVLTQAGQDAALAGQEIDAALLLVKLVSKARRDANIVGKDQIGDSTLEAAIQRASEHQQRATQRLQKAAAVFAAIAPAVMKSRRGVWVVQKLRDGQQRLSELRQELDKQSVPKPVRADAAKKKRWTTKMIVAKARATGLQVTQSRQDPHFAVWNRIGGIELWKDSTATRADVPAEFAKKMTLQEAAAFLFPDKQ